MDPYIELLQALVDFERKVVGPMMTLKRCEEAGIQIDDDLNVVGYEKSGPQSYQLFSGAIARLGGDISLKLIGKSIQPVLKKYPDLKLVE